MGSVPKAQRYAVLALLATLSGCAIPLIGANERSLPSDEPVMPETPERGEPWAQAWSKAIGPVQDSAERDPEACYAALRQRNVRFQELNRRQLSGIWMPVRLLGRLGGVDVIPADGDPHSVLDCRLALALLSWTPSLRAAGVSRLEHLSIYRPGAHVRGGPRISGHAYALAIDAARFHMRDGRVLDVLKDWADRRPGEPPCQGRRGEDRAARDLRHMVCDAISRNLFQIVLTPHFDAAHHNHVHLELKPNAPGLYIR